MYVCLHTRVYAHTSIHTQTSTYIWYIPMHIRTRTPQTLHFFPLVSVNQPLRCYELHLLFHKDDGLVLALCRASTAPHSHRNWHLRARHRGTPQSHAPAGECHSHTCFNGVSPACGFSLIDVGITASCSLWVKGSGRRSKQFAVPRTSTWYYTRNSKLKRWAHVPGGSPCPHRQTKKAPNLKIKQQKRGFENQETSKQRKHLSHCVQTSHHESHSHTRHHHRDTTEGTTPRTA